MGLTLDDFYDCDIRGLNSCVDGFIQRREIAMNDSLLVQHVAAGKIAAAVWGDHSYSKPIKPIKLTSNNTESQRDRVIRTLKLKGVI